MTEAAHLLSQICPAHKQTVSFTGLLKLMQAIQNLRQNTFSFVSSNDSQRRRICRFSGFRYVVFKNDYHIVVLFQGEKLTEALLCRDDTKLRLMLYGPAPPTVAYNVEVIKRTFPVIV